MFQSSGKYELVHPNSESVYVAGQLLWLLGDDPDFQVTLDALYGATVPLLDEVYQYAHATSSLEDHSVRWLELEVQAMSEFNAELQSQVLLIRNETVDRQR